MNIYAAPDLAVLDICACAFLAAAASVRAKSLGAHLTGAMVLGCLCGLIGPLLRETFLRGAPATGYIASQFPMWVLMGASGGLLCLCFLYRWEWRIFPILDALGIALAVSTGSVIALSELGLVGALTLGLINGLAPGLVRDMALGDTALLVERDWYATSAAIGSVVAMAVLTLLLVVHVSDFIASHVETVAVLAGASGCAVILLRKHMLAP